MAIPREPLRSRVPVTAKALLPPTMHPQFKTKQVGVFITVFQATLRMRCGLSYSPLKPEACAYNWKDPAQEIYVLTHTISLIRQLDRSSFEIWIPELLLINFPYTVS